MSEKLVMNDAKHSKINWTQAVAFAASIAVVFGFNLTPEIQLSLVAGIQAIQSLSTWIFRTWFTAPK